MKEQDKTTVRDLNETDTGKMPDREFKALILTGHEKRGKDKN